MKLSQPVTDKHHLHSWSLWLMCRNQALQQTNVCHFCRKTNQVIFSDSFDVVEDELRIELLLSFFVFVWKT
ncbi:hypothetical protein INR49_020797 [Caranx melampygus]|nr:hypothetical protein INR49_020797 [Caranx melampygus]